MNAIVERLYGLMRERGVNANQVTTALKMSSTSFTDWKNGKCSPGVEALSKLGPYFGVSMDYLITGKESSAALRAEARDREFFTKIFLLPPVCREKVSAYIDGMLEAFPNSTETVSDISRKADSAAPENP